MTVIVPSRNLMRKSVTKWVKTAARHAINSVPLGMCRALFRSEVSAVGYHVISDESLPHVRHLFDYKTPAMFEQDLIYLQDRYRLISYHDLLLAHDGKLKLPRKSMLLTFDDGYAECFWCARPLLLKYGIPCMFFVTTDWVDNRRLFYRNKASLCIDSVEAFDDLSWADAANRLRRAFGRPFVTREGFSEWIKALGIDAENSIDEACEVLRVDTAHFLASCQPFMTLKQVKRLAADGFTIGAHSKSHPRLQLVDPDRAAQEIVESSRIVQQWTGQAYVPFAFPFSSGDMDGRFLEALLSENQFIRVLFGTRQLRKDDDPIVNRVCLDTPPAGNHRSNVPLVLHRVYRRELTRRIETTVRSLLTRGQRTSR